MVRFLFLSIWLAFHPVHVSLLSIDHAADNESLNVFIKVYFDDFLLDAGITGDAQKKLNFQENNTESGKALEKYLNEKIGIIVNNKKLYGVLGDFSLSENELRMNFNYRSPAKVKTITVRNFILTGIYSDQTNMIIVKIEDFEEGIKLTSEQTEKTFVLN